jgi:predicted O-methyltransferase YrrM
MHSHLQQILRTRKVVGPDGKSHDLESEINEAEGKFLAEIIRQIRPKASLEIGLAHGISAMFICEALQESSCPQHIVIDPGHLEKTPYDDWQGLGLYNLKQCGFGEMVEFHNGASELVLPQLVAQGRRVDFAFIDGWHTFDQIIVDFYYINRMLNVGGVVIFDDANWPSIRKALRYLSQYPAYRVMGAASDGARGPGLLLRLAGRLARIVPWRERQMIFREELWLSDEKRGIDGSCVALQKIAEDRRLWTWFVDF